MLHEFVVLSVSCFVTRVTPGLAPPASLLKGRAAAGLRGGVRSAASHSRHVGWSAAAPPKAPHPQGRGAAARCLATGARAAQFQRKTMTTMLVMRPMVSRLMPICSAKMVTSTRTMAIIRNIVPTIRGIMRMMSR
jgi:hypothetical protein